MNIPLEKQDKKRKRPTDLAIALGEARGSTILLDSPRITAIIIIITTTTKIPLITGAVATTTEINNIENRPLEKIEQINVPCNQIWSKVRKQLDVVVSFI
jgi:hypothetical protein